MRHSGYALERGQKYAAHVEDHGNISEYFARIVGELNDANSLAQGHRLEALLKRWLTRHIRDFDEDLLAFLRTREPVGSA